MKKMFSRASAFAIIAMAASLMPTASHAGKSNCDSKIVVFSSPVSVNSNAGWCLVNSQTGSDEVGAYDGRLINPGSTAISLRYLGDFGGLPTVTARLNGVGFTNFAVTMTRAVSPLGSVTYDSKAVALTAGATGCLTVTIQPLPDEEAQSNAFHTLGASC